MKRIKQFLGLAILLTLGYFGFVHTAAALKSYEDSISQFRIPTKDVEISYLHVMRDGDNIKVVGKIQNASDRFVLTSVSLELQAVETLPDGSSRTLEPIRSLFSQDLPPGEIGTYRDKEITFPQVAETDDSLTWTYQVVGTVGRKKS